MKRKDISLKTLFLLVLCACLCLSAAAVSEETDQFGNKVVRNPDGSITIVTDDENPLAGKVELPSDSPTSAPLGPEEWQARLDKAAARNGTETPTVWKDPETGETSDVEVVYMGIGRSMILLNNRKILVNTVDLKWSTEAPEDKVLAVIWTPKQGYAYMRSKPDRKSTIIKYIRLDSVVRVISTGKTWTMVDYDGMRGYILTSSLEFFCNDHVSFQPGVVSIKGRTKGKETAWTYTRTSKPRVLEEYKQGTPLTVFDIVDGWAEVDICGRHCLIKSSHLTLEQDIASAD